jgi:hypothetical protein
MHPSHSTRAVCTPRYVAVPFEEIAERVGMTKVALYYHFPTKDALYTEVMVELSQEHHCSHPRDR